MNRIFYAERDTTLYEKYPEQNTGIDQILELTKTASGSKLNGIIQSNTYNPNQYILTMQIKLYRVGLGPLLHHTPYDFLTKL